MNEKIFIYASYPDPLTIWNILLLVFLFFTVYLVLYFTKEQTNKFTKIFLRFLIVAWAAMTVVGIYGKYSDNHQVEQSIKNETYSIVEGHVENYHEMPLNGHDTERFRVKDVNFSIRYTGTNINEKTLFYEYTKNRGGPIVKNGQKVKIHYIENHWENKIIKLWVYD
ncbi:hypothetical protein ACXWTF_05060 [Thiomicrolovo sp. ZZH C-3]